MLKTIMFFEENGTPIEVSVGKEFPKKFEGGYAQLGCDYTVFDFIAETPTAIIKFPYLNEQEKRAYGHNSNLEFRYYMSSNNKFGMLLVKYGNIIQEYLFNPKLAAEKVKKYIEEQQNMFQIILVEGRTNTVQNLRVVGFTPQVATKLYKYWDKMLNSDYTPADIEEWKYEMYAKYPTTEMIWDRADYIGKIRFEK